MSSHVLDLSGPNPWTTNSSRIVFDNGRLRLRHDEVVQPDGAPPFKETPHPGEPDRLIAIASNTLKPGEERIIARRLKEILGRSGQRV